MPAEGIHLTGMREAVAAQALSPAARLICTRYDDAARMGAVMLDLPYFDRYAEEVIRYVAHLSPRASPYGAVIHEGAAVPIVFSILEHARAERSDLLCATALGLASHAALDRQLHPLVNSLARRFAEGRSHDAAHREVEKFQSICFHEHYFGRDRMGTSGIVRLVAVPMRELYATREVGAAIDATFARVLMPAPSRAVVKRMARGYEEHAMLLGSPLGKIVASEKEKAEARPKFLEGAWGSFADLLRVAIARSVEAIERAFRVYEATSTDVGRAREELSAILHEGTIDPQGEGVDLDRPFVIASLFATDSPTHETTILQAPSRS